MSAKRLRICSMPPAGTWKAGQLLKKSAAALSAKPYPICQVDISNCDQVAERPGTFDAVIHLCEFARRRSRVLPANLFEWRRNLLDRLRNKMLFTSSTSVYAQRDGSWVT
jgi:hypothetical protein